ncbi:lysozyme-like domain protein [Vibrio phage 1.038.O._10N.286.51.C2]|nr:lysozyme-like domain protein [Vibrio phage 1.038.O._10N.286.51.C2]
MNFDTVFDRVIGHEGGFSDNPKDPGNWTGGKVGVGELKGTKYGIAANTYQTIDIKNLTEKQARAIYYEDWWQALEMDRFSPAMQFQMFDAAFNHGMYNASRIFQRAVGSKDDGIIGRNTLSAAGKLSENDVLLRFLAFRLKFYTSLRTFDDFGRGWSNRVADNLLHASNDNEG